IREGIPDALVSTLAKALAREPSERYATADDFARDLSLVLMQADRPVTYVDVGKLVRQAAAARAQKKKAEGRDARGVVGDLILDALHDFSASARGPAETQSARLGTQ